MKNLSKIQRSVDTDKSNFTPISNMIIQNTLLSFEARGLLVYILSLPKDWSISKDQIMKSNNIGRDKFRRMWKELEHFGYIKSNRLKDKDGTFYWKYEVCDKVLSIVGLSTDGSSTDGLATDGKPTDIKKIQEQKKDQKKIQEKVPGTSTVLIKFDNVFSELLK